MKRMLLGLLILAVAFSSFVAFAGEAAKPAAPKTFTELVKFWKVTALRTVDVDPQKVPANVSALPDLAGEVESYFDVSWRGSFTIILTPKQHIKVRYMTTNGEATIWCDIAIISAEWGGGDVVVTPDNVKRLLVVKKDSTFTKLVW